MALAIIIIITTDTTISFSLVGALVMNETRLHAELFQDYNKQAHPKLPGTGPVTIIFDFQLIRILDVVRILSCSKSTCDWSFARKMR